MELRTKLSRILGDRRITQLELAEKSGLTPHTISAVYNEKWKQISKDTIVKICAALEIDISELFELVREDKAA